MAEILIDFAYDRRIRHVLASSRTHLALIVFKTFNKARIFHINVEMLVDAVHCSMILAD